jgi:glycosyltransferase involved in cell wall biosynthesis
MFIHLHGGSIKTLLWNKYPVLRSLNRFFIKKLGGVIILGESHRQIFTGMLDPDKIFVVPNFAQDYLFMNEAGIRAKFLDTGRVNLLFMSNMIPLKGYLELVRSFFILPEKLQREIYIDFAGTFDTPEDEDKFMRLINKTGNITYHGVVDGEKKKALFAKAHLFCLPTSYLEGQPISMLEAYASGCVVLSTDKGGISDIFEVNKNGFLIADRTDSAVSETLVQAFENKENWSDIALDNHKIANEKYRVPVYNNALKIILDVSRQHKLD